jgi:DNA-binding GntR family transcriptional regulator
VPRKGTYIKKVSKKEIDAIMDARIFIETAAVEVLCEKITKKQLSLFAGYQSNTLIGKKHIDTTSFNDFDIRFHLDLIKFLNNELLYGIYKNLNDRMQIIRFQFFQKKIEDVMWVNKDHNAIITAINERDSEKAKNAVKNHLQAAKKVFLRIGSD